MLQERTELVFMMLVALSEEKVVLNPTLDLLRETHILH